MKTFQEKAADDQVRDRTRNSVLRQLAMLKSMSLEQLREKWLDLYGAEAPKYKKQFLIKRLAYHIQELFYGGLSEQARAHLRRLASNDPVATVNRRIPEERKSNEEILPGTRLVRVWKDRRPVHLLHLPKRRQAHRKPLPAQTRAGRRYRAGGRRTVERRIPDPDPGGQDLFCRPGNRKRGKRKVDPAKAPA
jgi:hypothetical protein